MSYVRTRLGRWFYDERGSGKKPGDPAIVLWPSLLFDGGMWKHQIAPLAALGRVIVFDPPGHGRSEVPPPFSLEDNADALLDAFGELEVDRAVLVGLSWGGMVAMRMALQHASRVKALALFDTSADPEERLLAIKYRAFVSFARRFGFPPAMMRKQISPVMFSERTLRDRLDLVERFERSAQGFPREGTARASLAVVVHRKDILPRIGAIRVPTLVASGREDRAIRALHTERLAAGIPGARLSWIEGAGHVCALEEPEAVNELLVPFVRQQLS